MCLFSVIKNKEPCVLLLRWEIGHTAHFSSFILSSCPEQVLYLFLSGRSNRGSLLKFGLAAIGATVGQRFCLKAVMADIAEIVVHSICTSNLCFIMALFFIGILFYPKVILNIGDAFTGKVDNVIEGDDDRQLFLNAHRFSIAVLHDLQLSINWVDHNNCAG